MILMIWQLLWPNGFRFVRSGPNLPYVNSDRLLWPSLGRKALMSALLTQLLFVRLPLPRPVAVEDVFTKLKAERRSVRFCHTRLAY